MRTGTAGRLLASLAVLGAAGAVAGTGTWSAFSSTTANTGNAFTAGTVVIGDNDAGSALYAVTGAAPGDGAEACIRVTYTGTLAADVRMYTTSTLGALAPHVDVTITPGTQASPSFPSCAGFTPDAGGPVFSGTLAAFAGAHSGWGGGLTLTPPGATSWAQGDAVVYRVQVTLADDEAANGGAGGPLTTGGHSFTWEARNR